MCAGVGGRAWCHNWYGRIALRLQFRESLVPMYSGVGWGRIIEHRGKEWRIFGIGVRCLFSELLGEFLGIGYDGGEFLPLVS